MNSTSKVSLPNSFVLSFYYYFSNVTFFIAWIIGIILFYTIFTQSEKLKSYKWFIFNHSLWCLLLETMLGLFKPILLSPSFAAFPLSFIKENGNPTKTALVFVFIAMIGMNHGIGLVITIINRYLTVFPSPYTKWIKKEFIIGSAGVISIFGYGTVFYALFKIDISLTNVEAKKYDSFFENFNEPSLIFISFDTIQIYITGFFIILLFIIFGGIGITIFFITLINKSSSLTSLSKIHHSLIISVTSQIFVCLLFHMLPSLIITGLIVFQIPNSSNFVCFCISVLSVHCILEFLVTLYFVLPYRRFLIKQWSKVFHKRDSTIRVPESQKSRRITIPH